MPFKYCAGLILLYSIGRSCGCSHLNCAQESPDHLSCTGVCCCYVAQTCSYNYIAFPCMFKCTVINTRKYVSRYCHKFASLFIYFVFMYIYKQIHRYIFIYIYKDMSHIYINIFIYVCTSLYCNSSDAFI